MKKIGMLATATCLAGIFCMDIAAQKLLVPELSPPNARFDNFLVSGENSNQTSNCVLKDRFGFVWTGTETGLYRFDGIRYMEFGPAVSDSTGFFGKSVLVIFEDSEGVIWVGTDEALNKLDQETGTFKHFFPDTVNQAQGRNCILSISEDSGKHLWAMTYGGIFRLDKNSGEFRRYNFDNEGSLINEGVSIANEIFAENDEGDKLFVINGVLYSIESGGDSLIRVLPLEKQPEHKGVKTVKCVIAGKDGTWWIGTTGAGLFRWDVENGTLLRHDRRIANEYSEIFSPVYTIMEDSNGHIWTFGDRCFSVTDPETGMTKNYIFRSYQRQYYESLTMRVYADLAFEHPDGSVWFLHNGSGSMYRFDKENETLMLYRTPNFIVFDCIMDDTGSFWFACVRNNLFRLVTTNIPYASVTIPNRSEVDPIHKRKIAEDENGNIWIATKTATIKLSQFSKHSGIKTDYFRTPDGDSLFRSLFVDDDGWLWLGGKYGKITRYNPANGKATYFSLPESPGVIQSPDVPFINEDASGDLWFGTTHSGLFRYSRITGRLDAPYGFISDEVLKPDIYLIDFIIDSGGDFWLLTDQGVYRVKPSGSQIQEYSDLYPNGPSPLNRCIRIVEDNSGNIWLLKEKSGVFLLDRGSSSFRKQDIVGLGPVIYCYDMIPDNQGRLWIANNRGVTIYNPGNSHSRTIEIPRFQYDIYSFLTGSGCMLLINDNQLLVFDEDTPVNTYVPPVYITRIFINGTDSRQALKGGHDLSLLKELVLPFRENTVRLEFAALNYLSPENNRYRYILKGVDIDTISATAGQSAEYKGLRPGKYRFWVSGSNNDGVWNPSGTSFEIRIKPPRYRSVIAYFIYAVLFMILISLYIRLRVSRLRRDKARLEAEIREHTMELEIKNQRLAEVDTLKTRFFTDISHEIRTPLSLIKGPVEIMAMEEVLSERGHRMVEMIGRNTERLSRLVSQLLDISKIDAGKMRITLSDEDLLKSLRILAYDFLSEADIRHIRYVVEIPEGEYFTLFDRDKLEKIISNLLSNAFKFTGAEGSVWCTASISETPSPVLTISVTDTGCGMDKSELENIFDRFYRIGGRHEDETRGTGIGLALVSEFIKLQNGQISVESEPGKGSAFTVRIPLGSGHLTPGDYVLVPSLACEPKQVVYPESPESAYYFHADPAIAAKMKILVIEDNRDLRNFIRESLSPAYRVLTADNGTTGYNMALTAMPDIIITDIMMPGIDGVTLCRQLKNNELTSHIPVIMLTARSGFDDKIEGLKTGADDYMTKPFSIEELSSRIKNMLSMREKLKARYSGYRGIAMEVQAGMPVDDLFMNRVVSTISDNISNFNLDVAFLQEKIGMSRAHLTRKLKVLTGLSPGVLIRNIRLEKASDLLIHKHGNVTEVACSVGMSNPSHFTKAFRKYFGVSPNKYGKDLSLAPENKSNGK